MNENMKYKIIKRLIECNGNKQRAAIELNCTVRNVNRMIKGYKEQDKVRLFYARKSRKKASFEMYCNKQAHRQKDIIAY